MKENDDSKAVRKELQELEECEGPKFFQQLKDEKAQMLREIEICKEKKKIAGMAAKVYRELGQQIVRDVRTGGLRKKTTKNLLTQKSLVAPEIILEDIISKPSSTVLFRSS
ncbi:Oidioi.mRNA.OKI2018_I69.XSR.g16585.t1.cds [Oikopleura dioica]|uniref:Oidioi.mRNA.OKI2018_I69.XSR.g16585.t1.cds n=1 Tax=Oikopleura dioica TaxID=34765 RepID=A0ABN7SH23_OIKDI|nr:Oidioi.mRNA.OKI2018_I69.XSR.g16585.t1.cds [Oikopleura dioica]